MVLIIEGGDSLVCCRWDSDMMTRSMEKGDHAAGVCVCGYLHITMTTLLHSISDFEGVSFVFVWQSCA